MPNLTVHKIELTQIEQYRYSLLDREYAPATIEKYMQIVSVFYNTLNDRQISKEAVLGYKKKLLSEHAATSVNGMLAALNSFFNFLDWQDCKMKPVKIQHFTCRDENKELTREEYHRLLRTATANGQIRLCCLLETICSTGIRVSEVQYITVEALRSGRAEVRNKGKVRVIFLPKALCEKLKAYCRKHKIESGAVFVTRNGKPIDRSNIWAMMKQLAVKAGVDAAKVFPHNLRHLFARLFYEQHHDLDHLAVVLGHSNVNTTRIYTQTCESVYYGQVEALHLLL